MKWLTLSFLVFTLAALTGCQTAPRQQVSVLTYNIHHGEGIDAKLDLARIAEVIQSVRPDLVALQEVDVRTERTGRVDQAAELSRLTGMKGVFGKALDYQGGGYGLAVLSRWPILESRTHPLPATEGHEPRALLLTRVQAGHNGPELWFGSTHLDHTQEETNRFNQAQRLDALAAALGTEPVIVGGDFNATPESRVMEMLLNHWIDASALDPQPTIPSQEPNRRIDYILFRPPNKWKPVETRVLDEDTASDHRPVFAILEYLP